MELNLVIFRYFKSSNTPFFLVWDSSSQTLHHPTVFVQHFMITPVVYFSVGFFVLWGAVNLESACGEEKLCQHLDRLQSWGLPASFSARTFLRVIRGEVPAGAALTREWLCLSLNVSHFITLEMCPIFAYLNVKLTVVGESYLLRRNREQGTKLLLEILSR